MNKISAEVFLGPFVSRAFQKNKSSEELHSLSDINYFGIRQTALVKSAVHSRTDVNIQYIQKKKKKKTQHCRLNTSLRWKFFWRLYFIFRRIEKLKSSVRIYWEILSHVIWLVDQDYSRPSLIYFEWGEKQLIYTCWLSRRQHTHTHTHKHTHIHTYTH